MVYFISFGHLGQVLSQISSFIWAKDIIIDIWWVYWGNMYKCLLYIFQVGNTRCRDYSPFLDIEYTEKFRWGSQSKITVKMLLLCIIFGYFGSKLGERWS